MNAINPTPAAGQRKPRSIRIDMTPMVDLGFLLITFFIFTSTLSETNAMKLYMPAEGNSSKVSEENVLTIMVSAKGLFAYEGKWSDAKINGRITKTTLSEPGIRKLIGDKKTRMKSLDPTDRLMILIKPLEDAGYGQLVDLLDEMIISDVPSYAIVDPDPAEKTAFSRDK
jgi:biopolymer transport protein ExbD